MIYLNKNLDALVITVPGPPLFPTGTTGWTALSLGLTIYNIETGLYLCTKDPNTGVVIGSSPTYAWTSIEPGNGAWAPAVWPANVFEAYEIQMQNIQNAIGGGSTGRFGEDKYWSENLREAHIALNRGDGSAVFAPDVLAPPTGLGSAGRQGYLIRVDDTSGGMAGGITMPSDSIYIHLVVEGDVNVVKWNGSPVTSSIQEGLPNINVADWGDAGFANITLSSAGGGIPEVDAVRVNSNATAAASLEDFATAGYDPVTSSVEDVKRTHLIESGGINAASFDTYAITSQAIAAGAIHVDDGGFGPAIEAGAIHTTALEAGAIHTTALEAGAIHTTALEAGAIHTTALEAGAIHTTALAAEAINAASIKDNAIDEGAIAIDSLTYEEISDSAVREIVNGIWNASVLSPIDGSSVLDGSKLKMAEPGSIGHAMFVEYISKNMIHITPSATNPKKAWATPMHMTFTHDPGGEKFYSASLAEIPLAEDEIKSYRDRTAVLFRGITLMSGSGVGIGVQFRLLETDTWGDGWGGAEFKVFDSMLTEVTSQTLEGVTGVSAPESTYGMDEFYLEPDSAYTWTLSQGTFPAEVSMELVRVDTGDVLATVTTPDLNLGAASGAFNTPSVVDQPLVHQQHLVRIADVQEDAGGQYFKIQLVDEEQSAIPGGIIPTRTDPGGWNPIGMPGDILIIKAETDATMHEIAHEVWEEDVDDHATPDTFGMLNRIIAGLSQYNHQITDSTYDESGRLLACRLVVYPNAEAARNGGDPLTTIEVTSTYDEKQNMATFKSAEEKEV
jgi:hypothetical protein